MSKGSATGGAAKPFLLLALAIGVVAVAQHHTRQAHATLRVEQDTYPLPPPEQVVVLSLGYRAALADFIYGHVLVSYGLHFEERRRFEHVAKYLETIIALDPKFAQTYLYADTLITLQPVPPRDQDYDVARELLLRGTRELPLDQRVWLTAGQFIGYLAPPRFSDPDRKARWQNEGARLLTQACELASDNRQVPYHCLAAATTLNRSGQREALIQMLTRTLAVNDDPQIRKTALNTLRSWVGEQEQEKARARLDAFDAAREEHLSFLTLDQALTWRSPWRFDQCIGNNTAADTLDDGASTRPAHCATSWADWALWTLPAPIQREP